MFSIVAAIGAALVQTLNNDTQLSGSGTAFVFRKKPFNAGYDWQMGAFVCPLDYDAREHENTRDLYVYPFAAVVAVQSEGGLANSTAATMARSERIYSLLHNKSGQFAPASLRALNAQFVSAVGSGFIAGASFHRVTTRRSQLFIDQAFQKGYDVGVCLIDVEVLQLRPSSSSL